jgi:fumarate reductase flavoprotein subunit
MGAVLAAALPLGTRAAAPAAGQGFLIDAHLAAGLRCAACHSESPPARPVAMATCLRCHGGSYDRLAAATASAQPNPHRSHQGEVPCEACHRIHAASQNYCARCHADFRLKLP